MPVYGPRPVYVGPRYYVRPYSGIFVYGPRPVHHHHYHTGGQRVEVRERHLPDRAVDRNNSLAVGIRAGSYFGAYAGANAFGDVGLGLTARYRPVETFGIELAGTRHVHQERTHMLASASGQLFAFPWSRVSPYILGGMTGTSRAIADDIWLDEQVQTVTTNAPLFGAHGGVGLEISIGQKAAIDLEARYIGYLNPIQGDPTLPGALTTNVGLLWHF